MNITNAGLRGYNPKGVVIHNDAGSNYATVNYYRNWLPTHPKENGFAHVYMSDTDRLQAADFSYKAWHCGNSYGNANYASWEVIQSSGDLAQFLRNEQAVLDDVAKYMKLWGLTPNRDTVKLHQELSPTSCPARSFSVHGNTLEATREYFIKELQKRLTGGNTEQPTTPITMEEDLMQFTYENGNGTYYYFNGIKSIALSHNDQISIIKKIYRETMGREMVHYKWTQQARWDLRFLQANDLKEKDIPRAAQ